jgi:uncharacterized protein YbjQ (UPF0145 family)
MTNILITTTPTVQNRPVREYLGIVSGEAFIDSIDSEDSSMLREARDKAIQEMAKEAATVRADAVIGVTISMYDVRKGWLLIATGTAVWL